MAQIQNTKTYDLEERTLAFAKNVNLYVNRLTKTIINIEDGKQLVRSSGSVGANYCEADNAESRADFKHKISICKKESKETKHWLKMAIIAVPVLKDDVETLIQEAKELTLIFNAIVNTTKQNGQKN